MLSVMPPYFGCFELPLLCLDLTIFKIFALTRSRFCILSVNLYLRIASSPLLTMFISTCLLPVSKSPSGKKAPPHCGLSMKCIICSTAPVFLYWPFALTTTLLFTPLSTLLNLQIPTLMHSLTQILPTMKVLSRQECSQINHSRL